MYHMLKFELVQVHLQVHVGVLVFGQIFPQLVTLSPCTRLVSTGTASLPGENSSCAINQPKINQVRVQMICEYFYQT